MANNRTATTSDNLHEQVDHLKADLTSMRDDLSGIAKAMVKQGKASATEFGEDMSQRVNHSLEQGRHVVQEKPLTATFAAFGVGILAGFLISRR